jgi:hypothetical protein
VITRVTPALKTELTTLAKRHGRSVAAETRHVINLWCAANRPPEEPCDHVNDAV